MVVDLSADAQDAKAETDRRWMRRALEQARRGLGRTTPNPVVGACVVTVVDDGDRAAITVCGSGLAGSSAGARSNASPQREPLLLVCASN